MIKVVAGILFEGKKVLIARRAAHKLLAGKWEFPGGKIDKNETHENALERELFEEFKIKTKTEEYIGVYDHDYGSFSIRLFFYRSKFMSGHWELSDHDKVEWVAIESLIDYDLADADIPIIPKLLLI